MVRIFSLAGDLVIYFIAEN